MAKKSPWESLELTHLWDKPFPLVRERLRTHTGGEVTYVYVPGRREWVCALPVTPDGKAILIRQYRHVWGEYFLELPGGGVEVGEAPEAAIRRELLEEAGLEPSELIPFPRHRYLGNIIASMGNQFLALGAKRNQQTQHEDGELIETIELPLSDVYEMLDAYEGFDAATVIILLRAQPILTELGFLG